MCMVYPIRILYISDHMYIHEECIYLFDIISIAYVIFLNSRDPSIILQFRADYSGPKI